MYGRGKLINTSYAPPMRSHIHNEKMKRVSNKGEEKRYSQRIAVVLTFSLCCNSWFLVLLKYEKNEIKSRVCKKI